jgi:LAO/AO transport system kinase
VTLLERFQNRDERALARAISLLEAGTSEGQTLLQQLRNEAGSARIIGMQHHQDPDVFIRSMATRGQLGGLAATTLQALALLDAYGFDDIFIETVGVGQSEIDIVKAADTTVLVLTPGQGDSVQAFKAGIMEIADVFVINKADLPGASRLKREIQAALELGHKNSTLPDILETIASEAKGIEELYAAINKHHESLKTSGKLQSLRKQRTRFEITSLLTEQLRLALQNSQDSLIDKILKGELTSQQALRELLETTLIR